MITNTIFPLHPGSQERVDAVNTIKYTLLLDYETPEPKEVTEDLIPEIMTQCQKCCSAYFKIRAPHNTISLAALTLNLKILWSIWKAAQLITKIIPASACIP